MKKKSKSPLILYVIMFITMIIMYFFYFNADKNSSGFTNCVTNPDSSLSSLNSTQLANASLEYQVGTQMNMPENAKIGAAEAALIESNYMNYENPRYELTKGLGDGMPPGGGDLDSAGIHQIRWDIHKSYFNNDPKEYMDVKKQAKWFFDKAKTVLINNPNLSPDEIAIQVERPAAAYEGRYKTKEDQAKSIISSLSKNTKCFNANGSGSNNSIVQAAEKWLGTPYAWGGGNENGPTKGTHDGGVADTFGDYYKTGFDCSGLVLYAVFQASDGKIDLPHNTNSQIADSRGESVKPEDLQPGDIIFPHSEHVVIFVGMENGKHKIIHAPESGDVVKYSYSEDFGDLNNMTIRRYIKQSSESVKTVTPKTTTPTQSDYDLAK